METMMNCYEGMFLVDPGHSDTEAACEPIRNVMGRSEAEILAIKPWEERRLAYEICGRKRGMYILAYFKLDPEKVKDLERDAQLNEDILRMLILRRETVGDAELTAETPAMLVPPPAEEASPEVPAEVAPEPKVDEAETKAGEPDTADEADQADETDKIDEKENDEKLAESGE
jgi:small subunit ribosomal protein S6